MSKSFNVTFMVMQSGSRENAYDVLERFINKLEGQVRDTFAEKIGDDDYLNEQLIIMADVRVARDEPPKSKIKLEGDK